MAQTPAVLSERSGSQFTWWPMAASASPVGSADALLDVDAAGIIGVQLETVGEVAGDEARRLDRLLDIHAEDQMIEQHLQHALRLQIAARRAERHQELALAHGHRRIGREPAAACPARRRRCGRDRPRTASRATTGRGPARE